MFERFTTEARAVVVGAQEQARSFNHSYIGTEHLLLALMAESHGIPATVLRDAGLTVAQVRSDIERALSTTFGEHDALALEAIGIDLSAVKAKMEEAFGPGALDPPPTPARRGMFRRKASSTAHAPFTGRAKKVLELSLREAIALRSSAIGAEHILLGLLREGNGLAVKVITETGVRLDDLRTRTIGAMTKAA